MGRRQYRGGGAEMSSAYCVGRRAKRHHASACFDPEPEDVGMHFALGGCMGLI
jgi:hypothetical protein